MIGRNGERGSGISALAARHDDDEMVSHHLLDIPAQLAGSRIR